MMASIAISYFPFYDGTKCREVTVFSDDKSERFLFYT